MEHNIRSKKMVDLILFHPHPASPVHARGGSPTRGRCPSLPPLVGGIEGGGKMAVTFIR